MCVPQCTYGGQRTTYGSWFSPSTLWVLKIGLKASGWAKSLYPPSPSLSISSDLHFLFNQKLEILQNITLRANSKSMSISCPDSILITPVSTLVLTKGHLGSSKWAWIEGRNHATHAAAKQRTRAAHSQDLPSSRYQQGWGGGSLRHLRPGKQEECSLIQTAVSSSDSLLRGHSAFPVPLLLWGSFLSPALCLHFCRSLGFEPQGLIYPSVKL